MPLNASRARNVRAITRAKVNLSLEVIRRRGDGFHEIETVMAKINLYDELFFERSETDGIELVCQGRCRNGKGNANGGLDHTGL